MRIAVLDLGTNTFHLLIVERDGQDNWHVLLKNKIYVKLAEEGIQRIGAAPYARGLQALRQFRAQLDEAGVLQENIRAFGTAALRTAENAPDFLREVWDIAQIRPESISGNREAELIYKGVRQAVPFPDHRVLILDIGGGSVEFIIADRERVLWQKSFPIGVAVLFRAFHHSDPIAAEEIVLLREFLDKALDDLWQALEQFPCPTLIGASGTFDVIDIFLLDPATKPELYGYLALSEFELLRVLLTQSTLAERRAMEQLPDERVEMVVVAMVLIQYVLQRGGMGDIYTSTYAMKEGMLAEIRGEK
ncbi:MAG: exopolyphosphatase [Saprospiraceae bacterium]|nr:exopolyphosphatase [Saprospiraceae bacterium]